MSEKARVAVIFTVVGVLLGGGLFYFFKIHQPKQARAAAQAEVLAWEQRWDAARGCLLGPSPASPSPGEALAVRELSPDPWERGTCTKLIGRLARGVAEDTGMMNVEHAWMTIDRAAAKVATAFATHVDPSGNPFEKRGKESPLPAALAELYAAHADLRKVTGLAASSSSTSMPPLPTAELVSLEVDAAKVTAIDTFRPPSAGGLVALGAAKGKGEVQLVLTPGAAPRIAKGAPGTLRAVPDLTWGAAGLLSQLTIGTIDAAGAFGAMTNLPTPDRGIVELAVGPLARGLVAYGTSAGLTFARASGSTFVADKPFAVAAVAGAHDPAGRALLAWADGAGAMKGLIADGTTPTPAVVELGSGSPEAACLTAQRGWVAGAGQFVSFDQAGATPHVMPDHELLGCTARAALLNAYGSSKYAVCTDTCRVVELPGMRPTRVATIADDKVIAVRARDHVLGVWREGGPPVFYATGRVVRPLRAMSDGKVVDVLAESDDGIVIVRVPAP